MSSNYPGAVDTFEANTDWTGDPNAAPATARIAAADMNNVQDSVHNTQATLGVNPQGSYATVKDRLDALAAGGGAGALTERGNWTTITGYSVSDVVTQTGIRYVCRVGHTSGTFATDLTANKWVALDASGTTAGGDLSGTLPNPTVAKVNGVAVTGTPTSGQVITATSGTAATWQTPSGGGGGAVSSVVGQTGAVTGTQILADTTVAAALTAKADASATTTALAGKLATTAGAVGTTNLADGSVTAVKVAADVATQAELDAAIAGLTATYAPLARLVSAGTGLSGGGDLSADRTLAVAYGTTAGTAAQGNDSRLADARTPTAHASSHAAGGSDPVTQPALLRAVTVAYAVTVTPNAATTDVLTVGALTGNLTMAAPSGSPVDGQTLRVRFSQDATGGRTITWNAAYAFGSDVTTALVPSSASSKWEQMFMWNAADSKWRAVAIIRGF